MIIAIDHGNYSIKTPHYIFLSGLAAHTMPPPLTDEVLEFEGRYWTLSGKRISYRRDKTQDESYFILTLFAIGKELMGQVPKAETVNVDLAVGLPPEHYGALKQSFSDYFRKRGLVRFGYCGKQFSITIQNVMVFPQAYAAVVPQSSTILRELSMFVVDIGGYTTDVLLLRRGKPDLQFCRSLECGIITMNNEIIRMVGAQHDMHIEDEHIGAVLRGQSTILPEDVKETIYFAAEKHARDILNQLRELQVDLRSNPVIFLGGGSILLRPYLEKSHLVSRAQYLESPCANAVGYEMLAKAALRCGQCDQ